MRGGPPGEETFETILKDEYNTNSSDCQRLWPDLVDWEVTHLALNRRKLFVIKGREKLGLLMYLDERISGGRSSSSTSSSGITCCRSLWRRRLARHDLTVERRAMLLTW